MEKDTYYQQRFFMVLERDMKRRIEHYNKIQQIKNNDERIRFEQKFLEEQRRIIRNFISQEEYARSQLKKGLKHQQQDIEGWWKKNIEFRRVKRNCINRFNTIITIAKDVEEILNKPSFTNEDFQKIKDKITIEVYAIIHLSDDYEIRKYGHGILAFCQRNKSIIGLTVTFLMVSSMAMYVLSNYHIVPKYTQTVQVSFTADDMYASDWAAGEHKTYGFYLMLDRIVDTYLGRKGEHKSYLEGLQYRAKEDQRYGNPDVNMSKIYHQSMTDGRKSNIVVKDGIFSSMLKNHRLCTGWL